MLAAANMVKKITDATKKEGLNFAQTAGRKIVDKSAVAAGDKVEDLIANKITSLSKSNKTRRNK